MSAKGLERVAIARTAMVRTDAFPYYASLLYSLTLVNGGKLVPTMAVDRRLRLYVNPQWVEGLSDPELIGVLWHEAQHVLREHVGGMGVALERHLRSLVPDHPLGELLETLHEDLRERFLHRLANWAFDLEVNDDAEEAGVVLPPKALLPGGLGFPAHLTAFAYAELLLDRCAQDPDLFWQILEAPLWGGVVWEPDEAEEMAKRAGVGEESGIGSGVLQGLLQQVAEDILKASSKYPGKIPGNDLRWAEGLLRPRVNWRGVLRRKVKRAYSEVLSESGFSAYTVPNRRSPSNIVLPGRYKTVPKVAVVVDTSGSVSEKALGQILAEVRGVSRGWKVRFYSVDTQVHVRKDLPRTPKEIPLRGGGGTDMRAGIEEAVQDGASLVLVFTDGYTPWPETPPPRVKVIAGIVEAEGPSPPDLPSWLEAIRIKIE